jgi:hypothetical protein
VRASRNGARARSVKTRIVPPGRVLRIRSIPRPSDEREVARRAEQRARGGAGLGCGEVGLGGREASSSRRAASARAGPQATRAPRQGLFACDTQGWPREGLPPSPRPRARTREAGATRELASQPRRPLRASAGSSTRRAPADRSRLCGDVVSIHSSVRCDRDGPFRAETVPNARALVRALSSRDRACSSVRSGQSAS